MNIAILKNWLEPFYELLNSGAPFKYRIMRLFGRIPAAREHYMKKSRHANPPEVNLKEVKIDGSVQEIVTSLKSNGLADNVAIDKGFLNYLLNVANSRNFIDRATGRGEYKINPAHMVNPGEGYIYSLINPHEVDYRIREFAMNEVKPIADAYLNASSCLLNTQIWATFKDGSNSYNPDFGFHYDLDDYKFLKMFIYLSDVDVDCGPHEIIVGSHNKRHFFRFFNRRLLTDNIDKKSFPVKRMVGPKGSAFFEDTLCYHRGVRPRKPRLIFQLQFGVTCSWARSS